MKLTKNEKEALFELMDTMTDRCHLNVDELGDRYNSTYWNIFKKLRLELKGY